MFRVWETDNLMVDVVPCKNPDEVICLMYVPESDECIDVAYSELVAFAKRLLTHEFANSITKEWGEGMPQGESEE